MAVDIFIKIGDSKERRRIRNIRTKLMFSVGDGACLIAAHRMLAADPGQEKRRCKILALQNGWTKLHHLCSLPAVMVNIFQRQL